MPEVPLAEAATGSQICLLIDLDADSDLRGQKDLVLTDAEGTAKALATAANGSGVVVQAHVADDGKAAAGLLVLCLKLFATDKIPDFVPTSRTEPRHAAPVEPARQQSRR